MEDMSKHVIIKAVKENKLSMDDTNEILKEIIINMQEKGQGCGCGSGCNAGWGCC